MSLIGRKKEVQILTDQYNKSESVFLALYGRRRVGKTFLIRQTLSSHMTFSYSGKANVSKQNQLRSFRLALIENGLDDCPVLKDWFTAFHYMKKIIDSSGENRKVVFLDEVAWMDNQKSDFIPALEGFWNEWASNRNDIFLIICASATSWITDNVFHNRGGLHNRVTLRMRLSPFTLSECEEYSMNAGLGLSRLQILQLYMVLGGVAWYWTLLRKGYSAMQNIKLMFLDDDAPLRGEFKELYCSLFSKPEKYMDIVMALGNKSAGKPTAERAEE